MLSGKSNILDVAYQNSMLYVVDKHRGLIQLDKDLKRIKVTTPVEQGIFNQYFELIQLNEDQSYWLATNHGLVFNPVANNQLKWGLKVNEIFKIKDIEGKLYIGSTKGLFRLDLSEGLAMVEAMHLEELSGTNYEGKALRDVYDIIRHPEKIDEDGLFLATDLGLVGADQKQENGMHLYMSNVEDEPVEYMVESGTGFFFGSEGRIHYWNGTPHVADTINLRKEGIRLSTIRALAIDHYNNLWIVGNKVVVKNLDDPSLTVVYDRRAFMQFKSILAENIAFSDEYAYIGTDGSGLFRFDIPQARQGAYNASFYEKTDDKGHLKGVLKGDTAVFISMNQPAVKPDTLFVNTDVILETVKFEGDQWDLDYLNTNSEVLEDLVALLTRLDRLVDYKIEVSGHTSVQREEGPITPEELSTNRARAVRDKLVQLGISSDKIDYQGYAYQFPLCTDDSRWCDEKNRRVSIKIILDKGR